MDYVVKNNNTLGYLIDECPNIMGVLAGSVILGGHDWKNGPVSTFGSDIRRATAEDFSFFRVVIPPDFQEVQP